MPCGRQPEKRNAPATNIAPKNSANNAISIERLRARRSLGNIHGLALRKVRSNAVASTANASANHCTA